MTWDDEYWHCDLKPEGYWVIITVGAGKYFAHLLFAGTGEIERLTIISSLN